VYRRYLKVQPTEVEDFIKFLKKAGRVEEAAKFLAQVRPSLVDPVRLVMCCPGSRVPHCCCVG
jgi:hypothetical protein